VLYLAYTAFIAIVLGGLIWLGETLAERKKSRT
jgi:hypothetical protein